MSWPHECPEHCSPEGVFWFSFDFSARRFNPWPRAYTWEGEGNREPPSGDKTEWFWLIDSRSVRGNQCWVLGAGGKIAFLQTTAVGRWESGVNWVHLQLRQGDRGLWREEEQKGIVEKWRQENKRGARREMGKWKIAGEWVEIADNDLAKWVGTMYISQFGMCPCSVALPCPTLFAAPWAVAHQAPLSVGFSRQEYWRGVVFPSPGDLPDPGIEPASLTSPALAGRFFTTSATGDTPQFGSLVFSWRNMQRGRLGSPVGHSTVRGEARLKFCWIPWHRALKSPLCHVGVPSEQHDFYNDWLSWGQTHLHHQGRWQFSRIFLSKVKNLLNIKEF